MAIEQSPDRARGYYQSVLLLKVHHDLDERDVGSLVDQREDRGGTSLEPRDCQEFRVRAMG